jgi:signal transduction histidine kinase
LKILLIEDNPADIRLIEELLKAEPPPHFEMEAVKRLSEGLRRLSEAAVDVVLLDLSLPDSIGFPTFEGLHTGVGGVPIVVLTGLQDEELALRAIREGAQDYLVKGKFDGELLYRAIRHAIERHRAELALRESEGRYKRSRARLRKLTTRLQNVREDERTRIAREIHDELGQSLTTLKFDVARLAEDTESIPLSERMLAMGRFIDGLIGRVREISAELRPVILDNLGLCAAIEWQVEEFQKRTGIACNVEAIPQDDLKLDPGLATALFRVFQEILTNVARHAQATDVVVRLEEDDGRLQMLVRDNGRGIEKEELTAPDSLGILGMNERMMPFGGEISIQGRRRQGTRVKVAIPMDEE